MQTVSSTFTTAAQADVRKIAWQFRAAFEKQLNNSVGLFTLDSSQLDGLHVLAPSDSNVVQEWDKYAYYDYSNRVVSMEWTREENVPYSVILATADVILNNTDSYFTRNNGSPLDAYLLPRRPIRLLAGFNNETIPQFVGLTTKAPEIEYQANTAKLHAQDFLSYIFDKPLNNTVILQDKYTHEVLDTLLQSVGLIPSQYVLDTSFNLINFVYFEKDSKLGDAVRKLMQAELGSLYMDELGIIRFRNRLRSTGNPVFTFRKSNIVDIKFSDEGEVINVVEIKANIRTVQALQPVYSLGGAVELPRGTTELFFNFEDPVTSISSINQYTANTMEDKSGSDITGSVSITSTTLFATAVKVVFNNASSSDGYLVDLRIDGTPAKITKELYLRSQDDASVNKYEEQVLTIENDFIQKDDQAESIALSVLNYYKEYASTVEIEVKGTPALQLGDSFRLVIDNIDKNYIITKITNILSGGRFSQRLTGKIYNIPNFFTLDTSILNGDSVLAP